MKDSILEVSGHLSNETIRLLKNGRLAHEDCIEALEHIGECTVCADYLAQCYNGSDLIEVSPDFAQRLLKTAEQMPIRHQADKASISLRAFHSYVLRVTAAVCLTLMLLFTNPFQAAVNALEQNDFGRINEIGISKVDAFNDSIWNITDKIVKLEVQNNDQKKK